MSTRPSSRPPAAMLFVALLLVAVGIVVGVGASGVGSTPGVGTAPSVTPSPSVVAVVGTAAPSLPPRTMPPFPSMSTLPSPVDFPERTASPTPAPTKRPDVADGPTYRVATRVVVPALDIDLPVMNQRTSYPACNVAMYLKDYKKPGQGRATYLYAHARDGMFLPLLTQSKRNDGAAMIGMTVHVYTGDNKRFSYEIYRVRRHARDLRPVVAAKGETIWLQTSEGPNASYPKLQVAGRLTGSTDASFDEAHPRPRPRAC